MSAENEWTSFCDRVKASGSRSEAFGLLTALHCVPTRAYHNLTHVLDCLWALRELSDGEPPIAAELAIWFHDAVYVPGSNRKEAASAELCDAYGLMLGFDDATRAEAVAAILATRHDRQPASEVAKLVVDADLSILGAEASKYDAYRRVTRAEWAHVSDVDFRRGRAAVLRAFLERESIFCTERGGSLFEAAARSNLAFELEGL